MAGFPNILLIVADCGRSDKWLGKGRSTKTPNLDALCRSGAAFPNTITEKSLTTPSFATLLTGCYSYRHGIHQVWGYRLGEQVPLLTTILAGMGYHTYAEVTGPLLPEMGLNRDFDCFRYRSPCDYLHTGWGDQFIRRLKQGYYRTPWFLMLHLWELHIPRQVSSPYNNIDYGHNDYEQATSMLDAQLGRVFDAACRDKDTLIVFTSDHGEKTRAETYHEGTAVPYVCKQLRIEQAEGPGLSEIASRVGPGVLQQLWLYILGEKGIPGETQLHLPKNKHLFNWRHRVGDFCRLLRLVPRMSVKDLLAINKPLKSTKVLKKRGLIDETVSLRKVKKFVQALGMDKLVDMHTRIFINSYKKHKHEGHALHVYDFLVKVPLVFYRPSHVLCGVTFPHMVRLPDILPTVLDMIGCDPKKVNNMTADIDGKSFMPLLKGKPWQPIPAYLSVTGIPTDLEIHGIRTESFKYTYNPVNPGFPHELYNLREDPKEIHNIAEKEPGKCEELRQKISGLVPDKNQAPSQVTLTAMDADEQIRTEKQLRGLGYID
jgi:arylsulfatase A-like enzyme